MAVVGDVTAGKPLRGMGRIVLGLFAVMLVAIVITAYQVGVSTANPRQSRHIQLAQNAVAKSEAMLTGCREANANLKNSGSVKGAQAIAEMARQKAELTSTVALEHERVASARSLLQACEDGLASEHRTLFSTAHRNTTAHLLWLKQRRAHLKSEHEKLTEGPLGVVEPRRSSGIRALQAALLQEIHPSTGLAGNGVENRKACMDAAAKYSVVFDIGSTGNRVHVYKYRVNPLTQISASAPDELSKIDLVGELFELNYKALSELNNPVQDAPEALWELFAKAKNFVPAELHACTPIEFKATAGLRMLGLEKATEILAGIRARYRKETFWLRGSAPVRILDSHEEGLMAWLTVNFLLGTFARNTEATASTAAIIDIGGGSTQIVFEPGEDTFYKMRADVRGSATLGGRSVKVYQHSYEGYGLHAATKALLFHIQGKRQERPDGGSATRATTTAQTSGDDSTPSVGNCVRNVGANDNKDEEDENMITDTAPPKTLPWLQLDTEAVDAFPCFAVGYEDQLGVRNTKRNDAGEPARHPDFQACANLFRDRLLKPVGLTCEEVNCGVAGVFQPPLANFTGDIYAFSFLFDLLAMANNSLAPVGAAVSNDKFEVKLPDLAKIGERHCAAFSLTRIAEATAKGGLGSLKPEYECMYYSYTYALLRYGYEVPEGRVLHVAKKISGYETAWPLGASLISVT
ncbi:guanosine diphosphatase, putative [Leishmania guyanensis]